MGGKSPEREGSMGDLVEGRNESLQYYSRLHPLCDTSPSVQYFHAYGVLRTCIIFMSSTSCNDYRPSSENHSVTVTYFKL